MSMDAMFTLELLLVAVVIIVIVAGAVYIATRNRRTRRETGREVGTADFPVGTAPEEPTSGSAERTAPRQPRREFYKSMGLETTEEMKVRVYSVEEYRDELGGASEGGFVATLKAYRQLDDEWIDYSPRKAADVLEFVPEDYEVDEENRALLVRRLPPGIPVSARNGL